MRRLLIAVTAVLATGGVSAQPPEAEIESDLSRLKTLLEISDSARTAFAPALQGATDVIQARSAVERTAQLAEFIAKSQEARNRIATALDRIDALGVFPDMAIRQYQDMVGARLAALPDLLTALEQVVTAAASGDTDRALQEASAFGRASVVMLRVAADQARMQAMLIPEVPWSAPMDNALAELIDGMASLIEALEPNADRAVRMPPLVGIEANARRIRELVDDAAQAISATHDDQLLDALNEFRPGITERLAQLSQAANELDAAATTTNRGQLSQRLQALRSIYRTIVDSRKQELRSL